MRKITGLNIIQNNLTKGAVAAIAKKYGLPADSVDREILLYSTSTGEILKDIRYNVFDKDFNLILDKTFRIDQ